MAQPAYLDERAGRSDARGARRARVGPVEARCCAARLAEPSPARSGSTGSTTTWCAPTRCCGPGGDAGVVRIEGTERALALSVDGNGALLLLSIRYAGALLAVAEAARNVACAGARPLAVDQLPELRQPRAPEHHVAVRRGRRRHRRRLPRARRADHRRQRQPLQRDRRAGAIYPTPTIGVVGLLEDADHVVPAAFRGRGDDVILLGETRAELGGSEYLTVRHGLVRGAPPALDLAAERACRRCCVDLADARLVRSAHDCSDGGARGHARRVRDPRRRRRRGRASRPPSCARDAALFGESARARRVAARPSRPRRSLARARELGVPAARIGRTGGARLRITPGVDVSVAEAHDAWARTLPEALG